MSHEITDALVSHPATTGVVAATATSGIANWFDLLGDVVGLIACVASIGVSWIVFMKHKYDLDRMKAEDDGKDR